ncbi:MAG: hypothetical protein QM533_08780 [Cytophagales bacterium]|nr:hypothetical protein [Cytophagales bacterium]
MSLYKYIIIIIASSIFSLTGLAQIKDGAQVEQYFKVPQKDGEFRAVEVKDVATGKTLFASIACTKVAPKDVVSPPSDGRYDHCLRLGDIKLGSDLPIVVAGIRKVFGDVQTAPSNEPLPVDHTQIAGLLDAANSAGKNLLSNPRNLGKSPDGITTWLYPTQPVIRISSNEFVGMRSYFVAFVDSGNSVKTFQLTGLKGETTDRLAFAGITLGASKELVMDTLGLPASVLDVPQIKGKQWNYSPFPFSIEFKDNVVYSIRVTTPTPESLRMGFTPLKSIPE